MSENGENVHYNFSQLNATSSDEEPKDILFAICAKKRIKSSNLRRNLEPAKFEHFDQSNHLRQGDYLQMCCFILNQ